MIFDLGVLRITSHLLFNLKEHSHTTHQHQSTGKARNTKMMHSIVVIMTSYDLRKTRRK